MTVPTFPEGALLAAPPNETMLRVRLATGPLVSEEFATVDPADFLELQNYESTELAADYWDDADVPSVHQVLRRSKPIVFRMTAATPGQQAKVLYVTAFDGTREFVVHAEDIDPPKAMAVVGDRCLIRVEIMTYDQAGFPSS